MAFFCLRHPIDAQGNVTDGIDASNGSNNSASIEFDGSGSNGIGCSSSSTAYQSVPLCSVSDVQLRFLCPEDLEEVSRIINIFL